MNRLKRMALIGLLVQKLKENRQKNKKIFFSPDTIFHLPNRLVVLTRIS